MHWFARWGWIHRPVSVIGWLLTLATVVFCLQVFRTVDAQSHSASDTLYGVFPFVVPALLALDWLAARTCRPSAP